MEDLFKDFKPEVTYKVTVEKTTTYVKADGSDYKKIGTYKKADKYNAVGDDKYDNVPRPAYVDTKKETIFQQTSEKTDVLALIAAVNGVTFRD